MILVPSIGTVDERAKLDSEEKTEEEDSHLLTVTTFRGLSSRQAFL